jgi:hypothetical protein
MTKFLFTFLCIAVFASCSTWHIYTKEEAIKVAKKRDVKKDGSIVIEDDNRVLKVLTRDSNYQKLDEIYEFNDDGKQIKYSIVASCDSCFKKYFLKEMNNDGYKWKKLNDSTYISKYSLKSFLNVHKSTYSFDIVQHNLSKKDYENLINNAEK